MGLLNNLGLRPSKARTRPPTVPAAALQANPSLPPPPGAPEDDTGWRDDPARQAALAMRDKLSARQKAAQAECDRLASGQERLDKFLVSASADKKKALAPKKTLLDEKLAEAEELLARVNTDLEALDDPETGREEFVAILARAGSKATISAQTEIDDHALTRGTGQRHQTATTTSFADGRGVATTHEEQRTLGLDGVARTNRRETAETTADTSTNSSRETKTQLGPDGLSFEETSTFSQERDGKTTAFETGSSTEIGKDGASRTDTRTSTRRDGSATSTTTTRGVERGEGRIGGHVGRTNGRTDTAGTTTTQGGTGKAGIVAGENGLGGFAEGGAELSRETKSGVKTGAVAGLLANIVCQVGEPEGDPKLYPLTLEVDLGASLTLSAGHAGKGASVQGGIQAKAGAKVFLKEKHMLGEAEAAAYVEALKAVSGGGKAAATYKELAIIEAGVKQGWQVAQAMFASGGKPLSPQMFATLARNGDSIQTGGSTTLGGGANLGIGVVGLEGGVERTDQHATQATRNEQGTLDIEASAGSTTTLTGAVSLKPGGVGGSVGRSHSVTTTSGCQITIDPKNDPDGKILGALSACRNAADYEAFIAKYGSKVTVTGRTLGHAESDTEKLSVNVGAVGLELGSHRGVSEERVLDAQGKAKSSKVVGTAGGGGAVDVAGISVGDSVVDTATAERDAEGNASLDLSREVTRTDPGKLLQAARDMLPFGGAGDKLDGALTTATGGGKEAETDSHDVAGLVLSNQDLDRIGQIACRDWKRWHAAPQRHQEIEDWDKAGRTIQAAQGDRGVVAEELARFIGGDKATRLGMVENFIRPGGSVATGRGYEFPDSLKALRPDYDRLVVAASDEQVTQAAAKEGPQKAAELGQATCSGLDKLELAFGAATDFLQPALKAEMLAAIAHRKTLVQEAMRRCAGQTGAQDEAAAARVEYTSLVRQCSQHQAMQNQLFDSIRGLLGRDGVVEIRNIPEAKVLVEQLAALMTIWNRAYAKAATIARTLGLPPSPDSPAKSDLKEFQRLKKACYQ